MRTRYPDTSLIEIIDPELLLNAYRCGIFPMADGKEGEIHWYEPKRRAIIPLDGLKISRSLHQTIRKGIYTTRFNTAFESVMRHCAGREETWISESIVQSYCELQRRRFAYSVETWHGDELVGGLYGVALGGAFFGESMFSTMRDASKVALVELVHRLGEQRFILLDCQFMTPHLRSLGAEEISQKEYLSRLQAALRVRRTFNPE
ncbi:MAG TPA: leucyl/phenylalanyl-tRNA--protein transferase [Bacteroidota bacterium]|nr:leucyl/phenylalanyl-tRNA--protein transferase [Bacteroidota bacterium]